MSYARKTALFIVAAVLCIRSAAAGTFYEVPLNYNLNATYQGISDTGFFSISDRGLITNGSTVYTDGSHATTTVITNGIQDFTSTASGLPYHFVSTPNTNDTVALTGTGGLPAGNYTTNTTTLSAPVLMETSTTLGVLDNHSDGGGNFNMTLGFTNGSHVTLTLNAADWVGTGNPAAASNGLASQALVAQAGLGYGNGTFDGTGGTNNPFHDLNLQVVQATVTGASLLSGQGFNWSGLSLNSITFDSRTGGAGVGIYAVTVSTPEPSTFILGGLAALGLIFVARHRKASATVLALLLAVTFVSAANAAQIPIALTSGSFNNDVVVENTASNFAGAITGTMDNGAGSTAGDTWYQVGLGGVAGTGLPTGTTFTSAADANTSYALQSAVGNNVLLLGNPQSGTMTFATPGVYSTLTVLTSTGSAGSDTDLSYTIHYQNGSTQSGTIQSPDWFNSSPVAIGAGGRVSAGSPFNFDSQSSPGGNPNLYQENIGLTSTLSKIVSIDFDKTGQNNNGNTAIWAVSGTAATLTPEPSSFVLAGLAAVGLAVVVRRRRKA